MAKKTFKANAFSLSSMKNLQKKIEQYRLSIPNRLARIVNRLADLGAEVAKISVVSLDAVFTGELYNSIRSEERLRTNDVVVCAIVADSEHAVFVELGTGIVGAESPYPGNLPVVYAQGKTIRQLADGRYGWFYERDGHVYFTEGMPSRPFMWFASLEIQQAIVKIVREEFR